MRRITTDEIIQQKCSFEKCYDQFAVMKGVLREDMYKIFHELGFKVGAEIGVRMGNNAVAMLNSMPGVKLYLVDPWVNYPGSLSLDSVSEQGRHLAITRWRTKNYNVKIIKNFSFPATSQIKEPLDFVYIDANHLYEHFMMDLLAWLPKVRRGGIIGGHDFTDRKEGNDGRRVGVVDAVTSLTKHYEVSPVYLTHVPKLDEAHRHSDRDASWFFVNR